MGLLYLVRHGLTAWNRAGRYQGSRDIALDPEGRQQASALAQRLRGIAWDDVWSSDLLRARETAEILAPGADVRLEPGFREIGYGAWEGLTGVEVRQRYPGEFAAYRRDPSLGAQPGGERPDAVALRALTAFRRLWRPSHRQVLVVAHGAVLKALILGLIDADPALRTRLVMDNTGLSQLRLGGGPARLLRLNDTAHLERPAGES